jgi:hypothetical protein
MWKPSARGVELRVFMGDLCDGPEPGVLGRLSIYNRYISIFKAWNPKNLLPHGELKSITIGNR